MSRIVIKDLPESVELDQEALRSVMGGSFRSSSTGRSAKARYQVKKSQTLWGTLTKTHANTTLK